MERELVFLKLGGSLITDKTRPQQLRSEVLARLASELAGALIERPDLKLLLGHGSGSFGHVVASKYGIRAGVRSAVAWRGYAETALMAARLNKLVTQALWESGVPVLAVQPSASAMCSDGELSTFDDRPLRVALDQGLVPMVYGDVALDDRRGATIISTEQIFRYLAARFCPQRILLVGEVAGVLSADPGQGEGGELIEDITPDGLAGVSRALGGARGIDVTGGMLAKVREMVALVVSAPSLSAVHIISGLTPGVVRMALTDPAGKWGTRIHSG